MSHIRVRSGNREAAFRHRLARLGVSLIALGVLGGWLLTAAVPFTLVIAWLIVLAGLGQLVAARDAHRAYSLIWRLIVGFAYVLFGVHLIAYPKRGLVALTLGLALLLLFEGIFDILVFFRLRTIQGSSWVLVKGIVTLILGLTFYRQWPPIGNWAIGVLVCASAVTNGVTLVILSLLSLDAGTGRNRDDPSAKEYWKIHD